MSKRDSRIFIGTVLMVQPYWILEIYATYTYFNNDVNIWLFPRTRPIETVFRDPWWVATCGRLLWVLKSHYDLTLREVLTISPRFVVLLAAMVLSLAFVTLDILSVTGVLSDALPVGVNPFWKLALVFKCLTDTVILDDFKTALDRLWTFRRRSLAVGGDPFGADRHTRQPSEASRKCGKRSTSREYVDHFEMQPPVPSSTRVGLDQEEKAGSSLGHWVRTTIPCRTDI